jgi:HSP20 family protein
MALPVSGTAGSRPARSDPFREMMESLFSGSGFDNGSIWTPRADIEETEDGWIVEAELPGVKRKDVDVEVRNGELVISGEVKERERTGILRHRTRRIGEFEYRVTVPTEIDPDQIEASLDDGVLTVTVPKPERVQPRKVEVKSA